MEFQKLNECDIVWKANIRERAPYISTDCDIMKTPIKKFSKGLNLINPNAYSITYEHSSYDVPVDHNLYTIEEENTDTTINIVKLNKDWIVPLNEVYCINIKNQKLLHTYMKCHPVTDFTINNIDIFNFDCIAFCCPWSDGFQHSIQDLIPRIIGVSEWLIQNESVKIILPFNLDIFWWINKYFKKIIPNDLVFTQKQWISTSENNSIYTVIINPLHRCEMVPYSLYCNMNIIEKNTQDKHLVVFDRSKCGTRVIDNDRLIGIIKEFTTLPILLIDPGDYDRNQLIKIMNECKGVIAPHGGANYNVLFMRRTENMTDKHRFFIELVAAKHLHHTYHIALGAKINYKAVLCDGGHYEHNLTFNDEDIRNALRGTFCRPLPSQ